MNHEPPPQPPQSFAEIHGRLVDNIARVIQGKAEAIDLLLLAVVAEGHVLVEDVPGVGKTTLAKALAASIDRPFGRIQFTPDLLPTDVVGVSVWNRSAARFEFRPGPVFAGVVLADEINRASPKTQSALLEAMEEGQVTADNTSYRLPQPFMVIATQNPIEHEGTFPLPESQLDRFLMRIRIGYPARASELAILDTHGAAEPALDGLGPVAKATDLEAMVAMAQAIHVAQSLKGYIVDLADATRRRPELALGVSPRAALGLLRSARARSAAAGRDYVVPDDIKALVVPVLEHRLALTPEAQMRGTARHEVLADVLANVAVPRAQS
ncbi:MAG: AAA family ATPase [Acidimicrobiales bacterium]